MKMNRTILIASIALKASAICLSAVLGATGELRMDFRAEDEVADARVVSPDGLELRHHATGRQDGGSLMAVQSRHLNRISFGPV